MSAPIFEPQTTEQLRVERSALVERMKPASVAILRRLREADALEPDEAQLLERYEMLTWLIEE